eukprot:1690936-Prymnesium_polylepis.2
MMLNLLIAMFADTYTAVRETSAAVYKYESAALKYEYASLDGLPPPVRPYRRRVDSNHCPCCTCRRGRTAAARTRTTARVAELHLPRRRSASALRHERCACRMPELWRAQRPYDQRCALRVTVSASAQCALPPHLHPPSGRQGLDGSPQGRPSPADDQRRLVRHAVCHTTHTPARPRQPGPPPRSVCLCSLALCPAPTAAAAPCPIFLWCTGSPSSRR